MPKRSKRVKNVPKKLPKNCPATQPPPPVVNVTRVERILKISVPEQMDIENLENYYRLEGMKIGIETLMQLPDQFRQAVLNGSIPREHDTIKFIGVFRRAMKAGFDQVFNKIDAMKAEIEKKVGFEQKVVTANDILPDQYVRIVRIPDSEGGGFCTEFDSDIRGFGMSVSKSLNELAKNIASIYEDEKNPPDSQQEAKVAD